MQSPTPAPQPFAPRVAAPSFGGLACVVCAVVLGWLPRFPGVGWFWSIVVLGMAAVLASHDGRKAQLPRNLSALRPVFAAVCATHALQQLAVGLVPLLWLIGAGLLVRDAWREAQTNGALARLDFAALRGGYRAYIVPGALLCLMSLFFRWGSVDGWWSYGWTGGMRSTLQSVPVMNYSTGYYEYQLQSQMQYTPMMYPNNWFFPGYEWSGMSQRALVPVILSLVGICLWAMLRRDAPEAAKWKWGAALGAIFVSLWCLERMADEPGPRLFFVGLVLLDGGVWMLLRGRESGPFDPGALWRRFEKKPTAPPNPGGV